MEGLNSMSNGAMASLLGKLDELARVEDRASDLRDELRNIYTKLAKLSEVDDPSLTVNYWVKDVRELSYDMENCVDQFFHTDDAEPKMAWMDDLLEFKTRVEEVQERYDRYSLQYSLSHPTATGSHRFQTVYREPSTVGMEIPKIELLRLLKPKWDDKIDLQLKVVSILGGDGVGKSTLAEELWRDLGGQFECLAFVQIAKKPDMRMILRSILSQIQQQQPPEAYKVPDLIHDIRKHLQDESIWAVAVWDILSRCFPEGNHRSRILTTTAIEDVAMACCGYEPELIFRMEPLDAKDSNRLFISRVFGTGKECPQQFNDVSDQIIRKCSGLPLAIICIASLLAGQPETIKQWQFVHKFLDHNLGTNSSFAEVLKQVLKLCYNSLPDCLRTCLLYLCIYPENYLFLKDDLVRQWIAEDFVCATEGKDVVQVASIYFDELRSLGLIQHMDTKSNKKGLSYVVHPTVFDFITCKSMEENFISTIDYSQLTALFLTEKVRRLSLHFGSATYATIPASVELSQVRSLAFMGLLGCIPSIEQFKLVRVMILHISSDNGDTRFSLSEICKLLLLRYLQVRGKVIVVLPDQMQCLKYLETLEINAAIEYAPLDIVYLSRLQHVHLGDKKNLTLGPIASAKAVSSVDSSILPPPPIFLQRFELLPPICIFSRLPHWIQQLGKLCILEIVVRVMWMNDINVLAELPLLTSLSLYVRTPTAGHIVFRSGSFLNLGYFKYVCGTLLLNFQEGAMPNLRRLKVGFNAHRGGKYGHMLEGIQHLLNLEEIAASTGKASDAEEFDRKTAESVLRDAIRNLPCHPSLKIKSVDPVDEEYGHSEIQDYSSKETEPHVIREDELSIKQPRDLPSITMGRTWKKLKIFEEDEIRSITSNYSTLIGKGGFGEVYRGILDDDYDLVVVKRYIREDLRDEFMEGVNIYSRMNHNNVVKLIGYSIGESTLTLVTEYICNGNLDDILHRSDTSIPLDVRLGIAIGCAEALNYMHSMDSPSDNQIYHGDIKPANILLDDNLTAKVSDFGLSRFLFIGTTQFTTTLRGSMGYMDPVYFHEGLLTPRNDVYSFGIVLLELVTRKRAKYGDVNLIPTFNKACVKGKGLKELFDAAIAKKDNMKILKEVWKLAAQCLSLNIHTRPQMNEVANRLRMLKKDLKTESILATDFIWPKQYTQSSRPPSFKKKLSFFKGNTSHSKILSELSNVRTFRKKEINEVTHNYSYLLRGGTSSSTEVYKGTLEDNTMVAVHKLIYEDFEEAFINGGMIISKISHQNIVKIVGCCLEAQTFAFIYEYVPKGSISDILGSQEDFPLDLRMRIAIKTADALQYLHSSETGIIGHGSVSASTILLDNNFVPKLTGFSRACMLFKKTETTATVISSSLLEKALNNDPSRYGSVLMNLESDVYKFGGVLMALINRDKDSDHHDLVAKFTKAYETEKTGRALFDKDITAKEEIILLEELARLALKCTILNADRIFLRPTMKEVAHELRTIRKCWKERRTVAATHVSTETTTAVVPAEPRLPNLMRHIIGYRRISTSDPVRCVS